MSVTYYLSGDAYITEKAEPIRCGDIELTVQRIVHHIRWFAAILVWAAFIADLGFDAC